MFEDDLAGRLDKARYVRYDAYRQHVLAWFGGQRGHAYTLDGEQVADWNIGDFAENDAGFGEVVENFEEHLHTGEYLELS
jgi:hypothetical protein